MSGSHRWTMAASTSSIVASIHSGPSVNSPIPILICFIHDLYRSRTSWLTQTSELRILHKSSAGISRRSNDVIVIKRRRINRTTRRWRHDAAPSPSDRHLDARICDVTGRAAALLLYSLPQRHLPTMDFIQQLWNSFKCAIFYVWFIYVLGKYI